MKYSKNFTDYFNGVKEIIRRKRASPIQTMMFHGTDYQNLDNILRNGFIVPHLISAGRTWGNGVYATSNIVYAAKHGANVVFNKRLENIRRLGRDHLAHVKHLESEPASREHLQRLEHLEWEHIERLKYLERENLEHFGVIEIFLTRPLNYSKFIIWDIAWTEQFREAGGVESRMYNQFEYVYGTKLAQYALDSVKAEAHYSIKDIYGHFAIPDVTAAALRAGYTGAIYTNSITPDLGLIFVFIDVTAIRAGGLRMVGECPRSPKDWETLPWYHQAVELQKQIELERQGSYFF